MAYHKAKRRIRHEIVSNSYSFGCIYCHECYRGWELETITCCFKRCQTIQQLVDLGSVLAVELEYVIIEGREKEPEKGVKSTLDSFPDDLPDFFLKRFLCFSVPAQITTGVC